MKSISNRRKFVKSASLILTAAASLGYKVAYTKSHSKNDKTTNSKGMLHNVYFWLKEGVSENDKKGFEKGLHKFLRAVNEIQKYEIGIPAGTPDRDVVDKSFGYSIFVWFKSINDHNIYQNHSAHEEFISKYSGLWEKVQVLDSELI